jgi:hypothetical protein
MIVVAVVVAVAVALHKDPVFDDKYLYLKKKRKKSFE